MLGQIAKARTWRLGGSALLLAGLCAAALLWHSSSEAGGVPLEPQIAAFVKDKQLQVVVALAKETPLRLSGTLTVELLGAAGERLADASKELQDAEPFTSYRFDLPP